MPSTITAFYQFTPGTKARSSEVDANFANMRGTRLPIEEDTAAASHLEHDVGSAEHRWLTGYFGTVDLRAMTTTAALKFQAQTSVTLGAAELLAGSNTLGNFAFGEFGFGGLTSTQYTKFQYQAGVTAGTLDLIMGSTTLASWNPNSGQKKSLIGPLEYTSTSAPVGFSVLTGSTSTTLGMTGTGTTLGSLRINTRGGGVVEVGFVNFSGVYSNAATSTSNKVTTFRLYRGTTTTAMTLTNSSVLRASYQNLSAGIIGGDVPSQLLYYDSSYSSGEVVYEFRYIASGSDLILSITTAFFAREL